jgi:hypothetical protein
VASESGGILEIRFPRPYGGLEARYENGELVVELPFHSVTSAGIARDEMQVSVRPRVRMIDGEVMKGDQDAGQSV